MKHSNDSPMSSCSHAQHCCTGAHHHCQVVRALLTKGSIAPVAPQSSLCIGLLSSSSVGDSVRLDCALHVAPQGVQPCSSFQWQVVSRQRMMTLSTHGSSTASFIDVPRMRRQSLKGQLQDDSTEAHHRAYVMHCFVRCKRPTGLVSWRELDIWGKGHTCTNRLPVMR